jgi:hypothetical protein
MPGPIETFLTADHARIDTLLVKAERADGTIDAEVYADFRKKLLRHIAMEEKVLLRYAREKRGGVPLPIAPDLRKDHGQIAALLVPSPTHDLCDQLRAALARHNAIEEGTSGLYATCDALAGNDAEKVVARLEAQPEVPVAPHYDGPLVSKHLRPGTKGG